MGCVGGPGGWGRVGGDRGVGEGWGDQGVGGPGGWGRVGGPGCLGCGGDRGGGVGEGWGGPGGGVEGQKAPHTQTISWAPPVMKFNWKYLTSTREIQPELFLIFY